MKALRSIFALVFVFSVTLMSVSPAAADSAVTRFTGTATSTWADFYGWDDVHEHGASTHIMNAGARYAIVTDNEMVNGTLDLLVAFRRNPQDPQKGPFHGTFTLADGGVVKWEGTVTAGAPYYPTATWMFVGHGVGTYAGQRLNLKVTVADDLLAGIVSGQVIGK